ncbi:mismatch-specific DNA-glycosylase [Stappia stellulata]|uniref:mismatch-specific DNA-glycosylase n=1 Tax=Stappia stellulata TaxID=71235 RepID=UPI001CD1C96B|nr:mismatch-specific DNA-glycosylase [Stappia stellulata]MCA1240866.1 mismatch-specific DNA-glycosylase [Stappia stellulata]
MEARETDASRAPVLPDVLQPGLDVVFCGTGAGRRSAQARAYYAGPGNRFWWALAEVGLTPRLFSPQEFPELPNFGIGLTDIAKAHIGQDHELDPAGCDARGLAERIAAVAPRALAFTSKRAAALYFGCPTRALAYGLQTPTIETTRIQVLPSPSGAARGHWSLDPWRDLAERLGR